MTESELKKLKKAVADLEAGLHFNAPKSFLRIMAWQAKEAINEILNNRECGK